VDPTSGRAVDPTSDASALDVDGAPQAASRVARGIDRLLRAIARHPTSLSIQRADLAVGSTPAASRTVDSGPATP